MKSGRTVGATVVAAHAATCNVAGARIGSPRTKLWMKIIAAPQCGQTKAGGTMATGAVTNAGCASTVGQYRAPGRDARGVPAAAGTRRSDPYALALLDAQGHV